MSTPVPQPIDQAVVVQHNFETDEFTVHSLKPELLAWIGSQDFWLDCPEPECNRLKGEISPLFNEDEVIEWIKGLTVQDIPQELLEKFEQKKRFAERLQAIMGSPFEEVLRSKMRRNGDDPEEESEGEPEGEPEGEYAIPF